MKAVISRAINHNADSRRPLGPYGYHAIWDRAYSIVRGFPLGTGKTIESAVADLVDRTNCESNTPVRRDQIDVEIPVDFRDS